MVGHFDIHYETIKQYTLKIYIYLIHILFFKRRFGDGGHLFTLRIIILILIGQPYQL